MVQKDARVFRLIKDFRDRLSLDLKGMTVVTEAGSGPFLYSALIAALAGAENVIAIAPDSIYATHKEAAFKISERVEDWGIDRKIIQVLSSREEISSEIDVFLNLGFVRPLDGLMLSHASKKAVVSYMCESWEYRPHDLDMDLCNKRNIPVAGVNEDYAGFGVFSSCGQLALKLIFEAGLEVAGCNIVIISGDQFGVAIDRALCANNANTVIIDNLAKLNLKTIANADAIIVASYSGSANLFEFSAVSPYEMAQINPELKIIQFAGSLDVSELKKAGLFVYPDVLLPPFRMSRTLAHLGVRPVIALHALGLKVGELLCRSKMNGEKEINYTGLVQPMNS